MKTSTASVAACALASLFALPAFPADTPVAPKPGPEHKRLGYFVGAWKNEGEMKPGPMGPGGKITSIDKCEWFEGGYSVVCRSEGHCPMGPTKSYQINSYSNEEKVYTWYAVDNMGMTMTTVPRGTVKGDTWTYTMEGLMGGKNIKSRVIIKELSPTRHSFSMDMLDDSGKWVRTAESTYTKVK